MLHKVASHTNLVGPPVTKASIRVTGVTGQRLFSSGGSQGSRDPGDYSHDPQVKEWLKELQRDFNHQSQGGKKEGGGMKEGKEEEGAGAKEGKEKAEAAEGIQGTEKKQKASPNKSL